METTINRSSDGNNSFVASSSKNVRSNLHWTETSQIHNQTTQIQQQTILRNNPENERSSSSCSTSVSLDNNWDNEIPIWVKNEQRWISGITDKTTCRDLIEALLSDEETFIKEFGTNRLDDYIITERWRRVEQILDGQTRILKIWAAWGEANSEVRLTLRTIDSQRKHGNTDCGDSGRGSPTGSINSAIERRRRHRACKSTTMWMTHAQTIHPKSQKATIEKLMKLILEQGETIQHQLTKLKDREVQISRIEEDRHKLREKEHGKNYLLETYLNGLHEADDKELDSGVNTEDTTTTSPEVGISSDNRVDSNDSNDSTYVKRKSRSHRESELLKEHEATKKFQLELNADDSDVDDNDDVSAQIDMLEKIVILNKRLQHEEELLVRLNAKIRRYESENQSLSEDDMKEAINRIDTEISQSNTEFVQTEQQIQVYNDILLQKSNLLNVLTQQLENVDIQNVDDNNLYPIFPDGDLNNFSSELIQNNNYNSNNINVNHNNYNQMAEFTSATDNIPPPPEFSNITEVQIHSTPNQINHENTKFYSKTSKYLDVNTNMFVNSMELLQKCDQRNFKNVLTNSTNVKLGPKKLINGVCSIEPDIDNGLNGIFEHDMTTLGTLV